MRVKKTSLHSKKAKKHLKKTDISVFFFYAKKYNFSI